MRFFTLRWHDDALEMLDQTRLPEEVVYIQCRDVETVAEAIESLRVRGAPAIGVAAAYGVVVGARQALKGPVAEFNVSVEAAAERLERTRPTAVNLFWALNKMRQILADVAGEEPAVICHRLLEAAERICHEDQAICRRIGRHGATLLKDGHQVLTHCNAGSLATAGYGTALGVIYAAHEAGKKLSVYADETRPLLQGSRLTAWELMQEGIDVTVICDNMAASLMRQKKINCVVVGADRIAANGDVANKIGTYGVAVLARQHGLPFYVAAPVSTLDISLTSGDDIPIEERQPDEVSKGMGKQTAPSQVKIYNPAFDVTPNNMVDAIISEVGIARPPFEPTLRQWVAASSND
jgi:methylthioribose-1-phosphate isomerase